MNGIDREAYDRGSTIFSPDGRLYQVEYAREAVSRGSPSVGVRTEDGVALAAVIPDRSPLLDADGVRKLHRIDDHIAVATAGNAADCRRLVDLARDDAVEDRAAYGEPPAVEPLATAVADYVQDATQRGGTRPFGSALLFGGVDDDGAHLIEADPSGAVFSWQATAVGGDRGTIQSWLRDQPAPETLDDGIDRALAALVQAADETEDRWCMENGRGTEDRRNTEGGRSTDEGSDGWSDANADPFGLVTIDEEGVHQRSDEFVRERLER